jgi:hypothetical protein
MRGCAHADHQPVARRRPRRSGTSVWDSRSSTPAGTPSPKSRNLRRDPRVSAGIVAPLVGRASSRGAQLFGTARTVENDDPDATGYREAFRWQSDHVERGRPIDEPPTDPLTIITPTRIVYTDHWLCRSGYAPRQVWIADQP